jgi:hypothetical protein
MSKPQPLLLSYKKQQKTAKKQRLSPLFVRSVEPSAVQDFRGEQDADG